MHTGAKQYCDACDYDKSVQGAKAAFSFLHKCKTSKCKWKLRDTGETVSILRHAFKKGLFDKKGRQAYLRKHGLRTTLQSVCHALTASLSSHCTHTTPTVQEYFATHPELLPGYVESEMNTMDCLHLEADGLLQCAFVSTLIFTTLRLTLAY